MNVRVAKVAVYHFDEIKEKLSIMKDVVDALEGGDAEVAVMGRGCIALITQDESFSETLEKWLADRIILIHNVLEKLGDEENCDISLVWEDPCMAVYVCWNHRKVWIINTAYLDEWPNPKTCKDCKLLIGKGKEG